MSTSGGRALVACCLLSASLGTIHAYSLFIDDLEANLGAGRAAVSTVYSLGLIALTFAVLAGHPLFRRFHRRALVVVISAGAATGLLVASTVESLAVVLIGYGLVFGGFNGLGYAFALQTAGETNPERRGLAMGIVTSVYALGAAAAAASLEPVLDRVGVSGSLSALSAVMLLAGLLSAGLLHDAAQLSGSADATGQGRAVAGPDATARATLVWFWFAYGLAVLAGLMALGHAAALVERTDDPGGLGGLSVAVAGVANALGGAVVAFLVDRTGHRWWLVGLPIASAVALAGLLLASNPVVSAVGVAVVALVYGAVIAVYPVAVIATFGEVDYPIAYGRIFTAWGVAGLIGPVGAGAIFDRWSSYGPALLTAIAAALLSALTATRLTSTERSLRSSSTVGGR